ncbi:galactonate dehydratase [Comamonas sp. BIGb0124]|uniref:mandelate racemase/muconate lactonizing enzyme family protein n=1 Tax=Comamonas sp. BIGb0124 TaxID=2485130 RepID=UPI000F483BC0|nr:mandelate racemase/muconate lactonizing enzyme family protein [Comamonas sp. BIGb0124]ROR21470.1 galactonate dehydratase [Comamonas sp. BIGb0124]
MKITSITPYLFNPRSGKNLLLIRVETDTGLYGWGECYTSLRKEQVVQAYVQAMTPYVIGRDPFNIRHTWRVLFDDFAIRRSSLDLACAWSGIEIALWDIIGKACKQPVYKLLGGANREQVRLYANGWYEGARSLDALCDAAVRTVSQGWNALKWDPYSGPWRTFISQKEEDEAVENVRRIRAAVGPHVDLLIDAHRRVAPRQAVSFAKRIEGFGIMQFEDPNLADNIDLVAQTRAQIGLPTVTGETLYTKEQFVAVLERKAADVINPDVCAAGGILASMELAAMAEPYGVSFSPHNNNSTVVGLAATLHVSLAASNFLIAEHFVNLAPACDAIATCRPDVRPGWARPRDIPGLGVDIDMRALREWPYADLGSKNLRHPHEEFPREGHV